MRMLEIRDRLVFTTRLQGGDPTIAKFVHEERACRQVSKSLGQCMWGQSSQAVAPGHLEGSSSDPP